MRYILSLLIGLITFSCTNKYLTEEKFHQEIIELHTFYQDFFYTLAEELSTEDDLLNLKDAYEKRRDNDYKTIKQLKDTEIDNEISIFFKDLLQLIDVNFEHNYKEIIVLKHKEKNVEYLDLEDFSKLKRFYRDTKNFYHDKEKDFVISYFKFINRTELEPDAHLVELREAIL